MTADPGKQAMAEYQSSISDLIKLGREDYGDHFDTVSREFVEGIGGEENLPTVAIDLFALDQPHRVIAHLAERPELAKRIAGMSQIRRARALSDIEADLTPSAVRNFDSDPAWRRRLKGGERTTEEVLAEDTTSDEVWSRAFKKQYPRGFNPFGK
jgi:hypothetical protein